MVKGVSKNIIEISDTGNECFERAILFVRPDSGGDVEHLRHRAYEFLTRMWLRPRFYPRGRLWLSALKIAGAAAAGAAVTAMVLIR